MKVSKIYYNDDSILVPGHLVTRILRKPIFYPFEPRCGFDSQRISKREELVEYSKSAYRKFYKDAYPVGTKIKIFALGNEPMRFPTGTEVFVIRVDDEPIIHCTYGRKHRINLIPGVDSFQIVQSKPYG